MYASARCRPCSSRRPLRRREHAAYTRISDRLHGLPGRIYADVQPSGRVSSMGRSRAKKVSPASRARRREDRESRANSASIWRSARRIVAVDATIFGLTGSPSTLQLHSSSTAVSYKPTRGSERPGDQVQLVLDDQIRRRADLFDRGDRDGREPLFGWWLSGWPSSRPGVKKP